MIIMHEGVPGTGKTYDAVRKVIDNLRLGRTVCTNIEGMELDVQQEAIKAVSGLSDYDFKKRFIFIPVSEIYSFWKMCPEGSMIVIDEVHKYFNSRDWQTDANRGLGDWASTHRHHGYDLIMITQNIEKLDKQARGLTEWTYRYKKINFLGSLVRQSYVVFAYAGDDTKEYISKQIRNYDKKYFPCYKSFATKDMKELKIQKHANILKHPVFWSIPVALIATIYFMSQSSIVTGDLFGSKAMMNKVKIEQVKKENSFSPWQSKSLEKEVPINIPDAHPSPKLKASEGVRVLGEVIAVINGKNIYKEIRK